MTRNQLHPSRRRFLWSMGLGLAGVSIGCRPSPTVRTQTTLHERNSRQQPAAEQNDIASDSGKPSLLEDGANLVSRAARALGTKVRLTIAPPLGVDCDRVLTDAFEALDRVEDVMSLYRPSSQLCQLNADGVLRNADPMLIEVLEAAARISEQSNGAFDVTVQPLWDLYASDPEPASKLLEEARTRVGRHKVSIAQNKVMLEPNTKITLNGIAQGFALDVVRQTLMDHHVTAAMIDTGEVGAIGTKFERPWRAGIQHPTEADAFATVVAMDGRCLSTSGDYATRFSPDLHHLLDPRTGRSPAVLSSVSVMADTGLMADALSTAAFILGPVKGMQLVQSTTNADAMMITRNGKTLTTRGFPSV